MQGTDALPASGDAQRDRLLTAVVAIAREAGSAILRVYAGEFDVQRKDDASPVTEADLQAEALIVPALRALTPAIPVVSEEAAVPRDALGIGQHFWLVDPLDGTREFIARNGEFTVNVALIERGQPVLGVIYAPAQRRLYGGALGAGAFIEDDVGRRAIACRPAPPDGLRVLCSRSHDDPAAIARLLAGRRISGRTAMGSSLKFGLIAAGEADLYARLGRTMEWDTAAGHAVLLAAGGSVTGLDGTDLGYGKPGFENPHFIARGRSGLPA